VILFVFGLWIVVGQTGLPFILDSPDKLNLYALITGALFCNGPVVLQALSIWLGKSTSSGGQSPEPSPLPPSPEPSSESSSGGN
jgi:hypothetical protein